MRWIVYPWLMKLMHRFNLHHTVTSWLSDGNGDYGRVVKCSWCGLSQTDRLHTMPPQITPVQYVEPRLSTSASNRLRATSWT